MTKHKNLERRALTRIGIVGVLLLLSIGLTVLGLTANSQGAKDRYESLIAVDQAGGDVNASLQDLQAYIYRHMNTQIGSETGINPPIQLAGTYGRLVAEEQARVEKSNEELYQVAQADCERRNPNGFSGRNRLGCIEEYIDQNGVQPRVINEALYKFDFAPPTWSPDIAGFSLLASIILGLIFVVDVGLYFRTRRMVQMAS